MFKHVATDQSTDQRLLVRPDEACRLLAISRRLLGRLTSTGALPSVRIGAARRYRIADLERFVMDADGG